MGSTPNPVPLKPIEDPAATAHVNEIIQEYTNDPNLLGSELWETYRLDFEEWDEQKFISVNRQALIKLRQLLRKRGVWVEMDSHKANMPRALYDTVKEEKQSVWEEEGEEEIAGYIMCGGYVWRRDRYKSD